MARTLAEETTLRDLYRAIFRHRRKAIGFFLVVMTAVIGVTVLSPREYRSEGKLYVRLGRENATLDPTATMGQGSIVAVPQSRESEINTTVDLLASRVLAETVVDGLGPAKILPANHQASPAKATAEADGSPALVARAADGADAAETRAGKRPEGAQLRLAMKDRDRAVRWVQEHLSVEPVRKSNVIVIQYKAHAPALAQAVVTELINAYLKHHVRMNRTEGAHEFLVEQADGSREKLLKAERLLRDLKTETGLADPAEQRRMMATRVLGLEDSLASTTREIAASQAKISQLRETLAILPRTEIKEVTTGIGDFGTDGMRQQLYILQLREQELAAKYTEAHPVMESVRRQVAAAKDILSGEEPTRRQVTTEPDVAYQQQDLELLREQPRLAALETQADQLRTELAEARNQLGSLNENELRIKRLQREVDLYDSEYRTYASSLEQSRIDQALEMERISNINLAQPATYEAKPVRPRVLLNLALGLVVGVFGGLLLALMAERLDHSFRTPEDVEKKLELPVLISVPHLRSRELAITARN